MSKMSSSKNPIQLNQLTPEQTRRYNETAAIMTPNGGFKNKEL